MGTIPGSDPHASRASRMTIALRITSTQRALSTTRVQAAFVADDLRQQALAGDAAAQAAYGLRLLRGDGVRRNQREGRTWCRQAAEQGHPQGQFLLGGCYYNGEGGLLDPVRALMWFMLAADQGVREAQIIRRLMASQMGEVQVLEARRLARAWRPTRPPPQPR